MIAKLLIDGRAYTLSARWSLRWVDQPDGSAKPVLYYDGKRITRRWQLLLDVQQEADAAGGNANTAEV